MVSMAWGLHKGSSEKDDTIASLRVELKAANESKQDMKGSRDDAVFMRNYYKARYQELDERLRQQATLRAAQSKNACDTSSNLVVG